MEYINIVFIFYSCPNPSYPYQIATAVVLTVVTCAPLMLLVCILFHSRLETYCTFQY